ncbi:MAG TPA: beta-L-arabinofuranosidase domain-containing protein, partial [Tepidisphaeraceae bacterium]|nr:beta-L-arabinofuranosidase domain-containing protein [Tepidisphaeraceae bacterium]
MPQPLPRSSIRLLDGSIFDRADLTGRYLLQLPPDRLLHNFRVNAGLPSSAQPLGGWESPACGLRGHFTGHYLSACAKMFASTGDERFRDRAAEMVAGLVRCQAALGGKYLSAFPEAHFDILEREFGGAWAPYYTLHKILAGLIDAHRDGGVPSALEAAGRLGDWVAARIGGLPASVLEPMLRTSQANPQNEFGGIGESLYELYALTGAAEHLGAARQFDRDWFLA